MLCQEPANVLAKLVVFSLLMIPRVAVPADPTEGPRLVADSDLPRGDGLAARFAADDGISAHPEVIFADNFEQGELGASWDDVRNRGGKVLSLVDLKAEQQSPTGRKSLQATARLGENTGGGLTKWFESSDRIFIRFYTKFHPEWDYHFLACKTDHNRCRHGQSTTEKPASRSQSICSVNVS